MATFVVNNVLKLFYVLVSLLIILYNTDNPVFTSELKLTGLTSIMMPALELCYVAIIGLINV